MSSGPFASSVVLLLLVALVPPMQAEHQGTPQDSTAVGDLVIGHDTVLTEQTIEVPGEVIVQPNATLTLMGSTLLAHGRIIVEQNATLQLQSSNDRGSRLAPLHESLHFWIIVNGTLRSQGPQMNFIEGLNGDGLKSVVYMPGGLKITGNADLERVTIQNSSAGVIVESGASLAMRDSQLKYLYLMGIAAMGHVRLDNVSVTNNIIGLSGRSTCDVEIRNSYFASQAGNLHVVNCPVQARNSLFEAGIRSIAMNGLESLVHLNNSTVRMYSQAAVGANSEGGRTILEDVILEPLPSDLHEAPHNQHGIHGIGALYAHLEKVTISGHGGNGIKFETGGNLTIRDSKIYANQGHGILLASRVHPVIENVSFVAPTGSDANGDGPVYQEMRIPIMVIDADGTPIPGNLTATVWEGATSEPVSQGVSDTGRLQLKVPLFAVGADGDVYERVGPFRYEVTHPTLLDTAIGAFEARSSQVIIIEAPLLDGPHEGRSSKVVPVAAASSLVLVGSAVACWMFWWVRRGRSRDADA